jgi:hypothetical protein
MQLQVGKTYAVKCADTLTIRQPAEHWDVSHDPPYLKPGDLISIESIQHVKGGFSYLVRSRLGTGVLHYDCGVNLSELMELVD